MSFLGRADGWRLQSVLWEYLQRGVLEVHDLTLPDQDRVYGLMQKFSAEGGTFELVPE
jgi:hypothetical protein